MARNGREGERGRKVKRGETEDEERGKVKAEQRTQETVVGVDGLQHAGAAPCL